VDSNVALKVNGRVKTRGTDYQAGVELATDGTYSLVIWMSLAATETMAFEIGADK
jgi:hypothetical protein